MRRSALAVALCAVLAACSSSPPAPVQERSTAPRRAEPAPAEYRVRRGDTLFAIAFGYGLDYRDVARWNRIASPYVIYPDQVLKLRPGAAATPPPASTARTRPAAGPGPATTRAATTRPSPSSTPLAADTGPSTRAPTAAERTPSPPPAKPAPSAAPSAAPSEAMPRPGAWRWPVDGGRLLRSFAAGDPARKGLDIAGEVGQPVRAAAPGTVVYSGSGLIGYGELIIVKHSDSLLSAYAHNRQRLVDEGQTVSAGEQIAELGRNDRNEAVLHFEIRVDGKPADPLRYVPRP